MPKALTIFGVGMPGAPAKFCYGQLRTVRGRGAFPPPRPNKDASSINISRRPLSLSKLELTAWDNTLDDLTWTTLSAQFEAGAVGIPPDCPVEPGRLLSGPIYGPLLVDEDQHHFYFAGAGCLRLRGIAASDEPDRLLAHLETCVGKNNVASVLGELIDLLALENDLADYFKVRRRLGVVEHAFRLQDSPADRPMAIHAEEPGPRSRAPARRFKILRKDVAVNSRLQVRASLRNFDEVLMDRLLEMPADASMTSIDAPNHVTQAEVAVYGEHGDRVDFISGVFCQGFQFGLVAQGMVDQLPPPIGVVGSSPDLESRRRLSTSSFSGPNSGDRSGPLDQLRRNKAKIDRLVGPPNWQGKTHWFEAGLESQLEVIRWIKLKLEQPTIARAYLLDPYLGTEALRRVILRNGNESIDLTILLSPGSIDPDSGTTDKLATDDYTARLVATATEVEARLCGNIKIIHVRRGESGRQAFHDRYLVLIDHEGIPQVFLLSNSLSKAAGEWPFAISEMNRPDSWKILAYAEGLLRGKEGSRLVDASIIWQRTPSPGSLGTIAAPTRALTALEQAATQFINRLSILDQMAAAPVQAAVCEFIAATPAIFSSEQATQIAIAVFDCIGHLPDLIMHVANELVAGNDAHNAVAIRLGELQRDRFLEALSDPNGDFVRPFDEREAFLRRLGALLAREPKPTNLIRNKLNPAMQNLIQGLERQRGIAVARSDASGAAAFTIIVALHTILASTSAPIEHRIGAASDYIHWFGRLLRTETVNSVLEHVRDLELNMVGDLDLAVDAILECRDTLGTDLAESVQRLVDDPFISIALKDRLRTIGPSDFII